MTLRSLEARLRAAGIADAQTDARLLLSHFFGVCAAHLLAEPEREYDSEALAAAVAAREARIPLQHILGEAWFFDECYEASANCLIPRADTELLVEEAIHLLPDGALFADLCTGSGCIALSVLAHRPDLSAIAVDVSAAALAVARRNAARLALTERVRFLEADLLCDALPCPPPTYILSNPPYIPSAVVPTLAPELAAEPRIALDGGEDGLLFYRTLLSRFTPKLFLLEIGFDQGAAVCALGEAAGYRATCKKDAGGNDRLVLLEKDKL